MQLIERTHHFCKRFAFKYIAFKYIAFRKIVFRKITVRKNFFRRCISRLFSQVLMALCLITVMYNSAVMAMPDSNQKLKRDEENVARIVSGILSYTHWPTTLTTLRLCLVPPSNYINVLTHINMISDHTKVQVETLNLGVERLDIAPLDIEKLDSEQLDIEQLDIEQLIERCDVIYYGQVSPQIQHQVINRKNDKPLLTIAENNPSCEIGSAFCLNINSTQATFSLNLDILTRSGVRVHPNVLQLARKVG